MLKGIKQAIASTLAGDSKAKLLDLAKRDAQGKLKEADAKKLADLLTITGTSADQYAGYVAIIRREAELTAEGAKAGELYQLASLKQEEADAHWRESEAIRVQRASELADLVRQAQHATARADAAQRKTAEAGQLRFAHPEIFGAVEDLDCFNLTHSGDCVCDDPSLPTLEVDAATFARERDRRGDMLRAANRVAKRKHYIALSKWEAGNCKNASPEFCAPRWSDILRAGHKCVEDIEPRDTPVVQHEAQDEPTGELVGV